MNINGLLGLITTPKWKQRIGDIPTPLVVIDKMIGYLNDGDVVGMIKNGETVFDPCCGHASFLVRIASMTKGDVSPKIVVKHVKGRDLKHSTTATKLVANELGVSESSVNITQGDSLKEKSNMKKFRVIMNPPFNEEPGKDRDDAGNSNNSILYQEFIYKYVKDPDCLQVVSLNPAGWSIKEKDVNEYKSLGLKHVQFLPASHFPTVTIRSGLTICNFEKGYTGDITITTTEDETYTQPRTDPIKNISPVAKTFLEKIVKFPSIVKSVKNGSISLPKGTKGNVTRSFELDPVKFNATKSKTHLYNTLGFIGGGHRDMAMVWSNVKCNYHDKYKVVVSGATSKHYLGNTVVVTPGTGICKNNMLVVVNDNNEAVLLKEYLDSPFVKFIIKQVKFNDVVNTKTNSWNYIPSIPVADFVAKKEAEPTFDLNAEIATHFNLTTDEQTLIGDGQ